MLKRQEIEAQMDRLSEILSKLPAPEQTKPKLEVPIVDKTHHHPPTVITEQAPQAVPQEPVAPQPTRDLRQEILEAFDSLVVNNVASITRFSETIERIPDEGLRATLKERCDKLIQLLVDFKQHYNDKPAETKPDYKALTEAFIRKVFSESVIKDGRGLVGSGKIKIPTFPSLETFVDTGLTTTQVPYFFEGGQYHFYLAIRTNSEESVWFRVNYLRQDNVELDIVSKDGKVLDMDPETKLKFFKSEAIYHKLVNEDDGSVGGAIEPKEYLEAIPQTPQSVETKRRGEALEMALDCLFHDGVREKGVGLLGPVPTNYTQDTYGSKRLAPEHQVLVDQLVVTSPTTDAAIGRQLNGSNTMAFNFNPVSKSLTFYGLFRVSEFDTRYLKIENVNQTGIGFDISNFTIFNHENGDVAESVTYSVLMSILESLTYQVRIAKQ